MSEFVQKLFSENNSNAAITLYSGWHFFYLILIFGTALALSLVLRNKSAKAKNIVISVFAYLTIGLYIADFFIMPLSDSYSFEISAYKLPFNICTLMAVLVPFAQFNRHFAKIRPIVVILSMTSTIMWMTYPGTALGGQPPFSYIIFQTFMYHGFLFNWACLSVSLGETKITIKRCWRDFIGILVVLVWAKLGNAIYPGWNWFFIEESIFPFISDTWIPIAVIFGVFAVALGVYGMYYLISLITHAVEHAIAKRRARQESLPTK